MTAPDPSLSRLLAQQPHNLISRKNTREQEISYLADLSYKIRILSGVLQNCINNAVYEIERSYPALIKHDFKKALKDIKKHELNIAIKEHRITGNYDDDEYFDDRADFLHKLASKEHFHLYNTLHRYFSSRGCPEPKLPATLATALYVCKVIVASMNIAIKQQPVSNDNMQRFKAAFADEHERAYPPRRRAAEIALRLSTFKQPHQCEFGGFFEGLTIPDPYATQIAETLTAYAIKLIDRQSWVQIAQQEREELGEEALLTEEPTPFEYNKQ